MTVPSAVDPSCAARALWLGHGRGFDVRFASRLLVSQRAADRGPERWLHAQTRHRRRQARAT
jgi:hypothetical protein